MMTVLLKIFTGMLIVTAGLLFGMYGNDWEGLGSLLREKIENEDSTVLPRFSIDLKDKAPTLAFVSATEYTKGDGNGSTIVKLIDWRGSKINTTCWETILYPNKTTYVEWSEMTQHWEYGNYYMNFEVPLTLGIYDQEVRCNVSNKNISIGKGFHVGNLSSIVESQANNLKVDRMSVMS